MSEKQLFNDGWKFTKEKADITLQEINSKDIKWQEVEIPHDWLIYNSNDLYETSSGWYKKSFICNSNIKENRIALRFEGVYMDSTVYVNDVKAGEWKYGYSTFEFDITDLLKEGENEVKVQVVHKSPNSRWYSGAGIYRNVWLKTMPNTHVVSDGIYISTKKEEDNWKIEIETEIAGDKKTAEIKVKHTVIDNKGNIAAVSDNNIKLSDKVEVDKQFIDVKAPMLWDIDTPTLYKLKTELIADGKTIEEEIQSFGFRTIEFTTDKGFFLNGRHVRLNGMCQHHDLGCLGSAVNKVAIRRQFQMLKKMGVNAVRTSHNMPAVELMELADEMGMLIDAEAFDMWEKSKTEYDYARFFNDWVEKDVASWVRRDRNHPSLIMWSIGNEIYDTHAGERGQEITRMLQKLVQSHDPKGNARATIGSNYMPWENAQKCADILKLAGYNYAEKYYAEHHKDHKDWIIYGSETGSVVQSRGIYHFPYAQSVLSDDDEQCSSLGNSTTSWGAKNTEYAITADRDTPYSLGQFVWTGFDYIGEPTPYFTKNSYFGQIDTAGFPKDSFYMYKAEWTDYKKAPMVHIFPYWDFNEGQMIDVRVCSNAPKIELFFNEESLGTFNIDHEKGHKLTGDWKIPYTKGTLKAVAYDEAGNVITVDTKSSFKDAAKLVLAPDKTELRADGRDLIFVEISMVDENGVPVENANNRVEVSVTGAGRLVGLDNGDSTDFDQYKGTSRRLFSGKLLAVIAAKLEPGEINVEVSSLGIKTESISFKAVPCEKPSGIAAFTENCKSEKIEEIPIRKIELISSEGNKLNENLTKVRVHAEIYPKNATYKDLEWRVTNATGIDSNIASVEADGNDAVITALGDGNLKLRCTTKNGSDKVKVISELEFEITGLGRANLDPYEFVAGGLYNASNCELGNGNERGVSTLREGDSYVGFKGVDFGEYGADEITLPIFELEGRPFPIEIWEGMPDEKGSEMVAKVIYDKGTKWNTYIDATYKLPRRFKGVTTICFVLRQHKLHIKGFVFKKIDKAYEKLWAKENNAIYGDSFTTTENAIEKIGNNVSVVYKNMDFGETGFSKLIICGRSEIEKNTIHVRFNGENGEVKQIAEFNRSEGYVEREFNLDSVKGMQEVTFVFLPGSQFDFKWFKFVK